MENVDAATAIPSDQTLSAEQVVKHEAREIDEVSQYDYAIINDDLDRALVELSSIVSAARLRPERMKDQVERIRKQFR